MITPATLRRHLLDLQRQQEAMASQLGTAVDMLEHIWQMELADQPPADEPAGSPRRSRTQEDPSTRTE